VTSPFVALFRKDGSHLQWCIKQSGYSVSKTRSDILYVKKRINVVVLIPPVFVIVVLIKGEPVYVELSAH